MTEALVKMIKWEARSTSNLISEEFGIAHKHILEKIKSFGVEIMTVSFDKMFIKSTYINSRWQEYPNYSINRDWYMFLVMNISTKKAHNKKLQFIEAFNSMERYILNKDNTEWNKTRELWKSVRLECTDKIQEFIEYAKSQWASSWVKFYYANLTKSEYKALKLIQNDKPKTRDMLDKMELSHLMIAENIVTKVIEVEMKKEIHYKEIYLLCKIALDNFAWTLYLDEKLDYPKLLK